MNFLAHAFLSGGKKDLIIGNFIADFVKGKTIETYREGIRQGIYLHRKIDAYTDSHPVVFQTKTRLKPHFGRYAPVVADLYYDHYLANLWTDYSEVPLADFSKEIYKTIKEETTIPEGITKLLPYMEKDDWLFHYQSFWGMEQAFNGMSRRASFASNMENGVVIMKLDYKAYQQDFKLFFPDLNGYVQRLLKNEL